MQSVCGKTEGGNTTGRMNVVVMFRSSTVRQGLSWLPVHQDQKAENNICALELGEFNLVLL